MSSFVKQGSGNITFTEWQRWQARQTQWEDTRRWGVSFCAVMAVCGGVVWWSVHLQSAPVIASEPPPAAIAIDMTPVAVSSPTPPTDVPPGPQQMLSVPDEPAPVEPPKISAPPSPAPSPPVPVLQPEKPHKLAKKHKPTLNLQKPVPQKTPPAETTTAPPTANVAPAPAQAASTSGASSSQASQTPVTWQGALLAQLEKFKRYPADAMAEHQEGAPVITFSIDRKGHVVSVALTHSCGHPELDAEAVALPKRAQPLPVPPDSVPGDPITLTVPVEFYIHRN